MHLPLIAAAAASLWSGVHEMERPVLDTSALEAISATAPAEPGVDPEAEPEAEDTAPLAQRSDPDGGNPVIQRDDMSVDLHAHLFMKPGMTFFFRGGFFGPIRARGWKSRFDNQINPKAMQDSGIGLVVVALYANPIFTWKPRAAIREEIRQAEQFVAQHPEWVIARSAAEAREAFAQGKRVMVFSLERASWVLENDADIREFVDQKGIRIVTLLHLTDDRYGGAAFLKGYHALSNPLRWFISLFRPKFAKDGSKVNARGLTGAGEAMARKLIQHGVWIDLAHASDASQKRLIPLIEQAGHPVLYTHGGLRRYMHVERGVSDAQLEAVRRTDGVVGLCPSEDTVNPTRGVPQRYCGGRSCPAKCDWGVPGFVAHYAAAVEMVGQDNVFVGSDFNGAIPHLHPSCGTGTELDRVGFWNIGQSGEFWRAMRALGAPLPTRLSDQVDAFISKWERVKPVTLPAPSLVERI